jgi:hypothetical protein
MWPRSPPGGGRRLKGWTTARRGKVGGRWDVAIWEERAGARGARPTIRYGFAARGGGASSRGAKSGSRYGFFRT